MSSIMHTPSTTLCLEIIPPDAGIDYKDSQVTLATERKWLDFVYVSYHRAAADQKELL